MAAAASTSSSGPRYAPDDPTLPKPWKGLVDGNTGYLYFWNPDTNVTQYDRPVATSLPGPPRLPPPPPKSTSVPISSSVHVREPSGSSALGHQQHHSKEVDSRHGSSNNGPKLAPIPGARNHQGSRGGSSHTHNVPNGAVNAGHGTSSMHNHSSGSQTLRSSAKAHGSVDTGGGSSVESYRRQHEISVSGVDVPAPFMTFDTSGFPSEILREVHHAGFSAPTPIQAQSWPIALQSRDIVAIAKTGSGKTLGYLLPGFIHIKRCRNNPVKGPTVLVLSPTRELATQIQDEAVKFGRSSRILCTCLYGGAPKGPQLRDLDRGVDIVVATPGRLNDFLEMRRVSLRQVSYLVLDEADRMLDMGFEPQIRKIVKELPTRRQTLMYTATWPKEVRKIAADLLVNPVQVNIGSIDELVANKSITQYIELIAPIEKQRRLEQILRSQEPGSKVIIFCTTKRMCDQLSRSITRQFGAAAIHGDKSQGERDYVLNQFRTGKSPILVATDVAARGLDIKDIRVVINYDFPTGIEDYVHRIGRTGRAGATGVAYTFFCDQDAKYAKDLIKVLEGAGQRVPPEIRNMATRGRGMGKARRQWGSGGRSNVASRDDLGLPGKGGGKGLPPSSGRSERARGGRVQDDREGRDRHDRGHHEGHEVVARGKQDRVFPAEPIDRKDRVRGRSRSPRSSLNKGHDRGVHSRSRSRSRNRNQDHRRSRSRDGHGKGAMHGPSPRLIRDGSPGIHKQVDPVQSPLPSQQQWRSPPYHGGDVDEPIETSFASPQRERSRSPFGSRHLRSRSPYDNRCIRSRSPSDNGRMRSQSPSGNRRMRSKSPYNSRRMRLQSPYDSRHARDSPHEGVEAGELVDGDDPHWRPRRPLSPYGEEEEEGMIPDEDGMIPADEEGMIPEEDSRMSPEKGNHPILFK
ncbi:WW domain-containing protein [Cinnamomum micranthum f. kanehirae]|uniref:RNA helicase n=1 Tax=Cinnamomum micranthum f. kanehirae TaxID=337451 RepID=A0A3S3ME66_9MAGN|nr:WW domain-containing protein [Cinnamomum micranthum f. kanehirae]